MFFLSAILAVTLASLIVAIGLFFMAIALPFLALLAGNFTAVLSQRSGNWNVSAPAGINSFDYGSFPSTSGDFFRNVHIANVHSHNDYWRDVPLLTSLGYGCASTEADVWLVGDQLLVGHDVASLRPQRTFAALYIEPLVRILDQKNPTNEYTSYAKTQFGYSELNGVYDTDSAVSLQLLVDVKTPGEQTWPYVVNALQPLRDRGYLSYVNESDTSIHNRPVTVIGTGDTPLPYLLARPNRDYFFDAPLAMLNSTFVPTLSPLASASLRATIGWTGIFEATSVQRGNISTIVDQAHANNLKVRFWDNPTWPLFARDRVWRTFLDLGVDFINADDLDAATSL